MDGKTLSIFAPAKINLFLHITGKKQNGYHTLDSLVGFADIGDDIIIEAADSFSFHLDGRFGYALQGGFADSDNLVVRAAKMLAQAADTPLNLRITLVKNLPVAAGIGGGSADAAAALWGLCEYWSIPRNADFLPTIMQQLGADVPVCFTSAPQIMRGIGDDLSPAPDMPDIPMMLINPMLPCATETVFLHYNGMHKNVTTIPHSFAAPHELTAWLKTVSNDLYLPATRSVPEIENVIKALENAPRCLLGRMSGSGATCFGLFETIEDAQNAAKTIRQDSPDWWVETGWLNRPERY